MSLQLPPLLEEEGTPSLRDAIGTLMVRARRSDFAVQHVRLGAIDFTAGELAQARCRLLLGRFDADLLADLGGDPAARRRLEVMVDFLDSGRLAVRAAGLVRWYPDFSIHYRIRAAQPRAVALIGAHQLTHTGGGYQPLASVLSGPPVTRVARQFRLLWSRAHDVREVLRNELRARGR